MPIHVHRIDGTHLGLVETRQEFLSLLYRYHHDGRKQIVVKGKLCGKNYSDTYNVSELIGSLLKGSVASDCKE